MSALINDLRGVDTLRRRGAEQLKPSSPENDCAEDFYAAARCGHPEIVISQRCALRARGTVAHKQVSPLARPSVKDHSTSHSLCLVVEDRADRFPSMFLSFSNETVRCRLLGSHFTCQRLLALPR